jgi:diguanylate cyclase (GGDEF)-like protein/PAS domain S-box-containing protein
LGAAARALIDGLPELVLVVEADATILRGNATVERVLGYAPDEYVGHNAAEFVHPEDVAYALQCLDSRLAAPGRPGLPVEFRIVTKGGEIRRCQVVGVDLRHVPEIGGVVTSIRDITNRPALADSPERLRALVDNSLDLTLLVDRDGTVRYSSQAMCRLLGHDPDRLVGTPFRDLFHHVDAADAERRLAELVSSGARSTGWRARLVDVDGAVHLYEQNVVNHLDDPTIAGIIMTARDVSALREAEERFRDVFDHAPIGMALLDPERRFVQVNQALCRLVGADASWFLGSSLERVIEPGERSSDLSSVLDVGASLSGDHTQVERRLVRTDGRMSWVRLGLSVMRKPDGGVDHVIAHFEDVTARKEMERLLRDQNERLSFQANYDALTGLPNRMLFERTLERIADGPDRRVAVLFCDLDGFKDVNDSFGHDGGDAVLAEIADRLRGAVRDGDTVARFGGDEFVVLCVGNVDVEGLAALAERIDSTVREPIELETGVAALGVSVGIAETWSHADDVALLTLRADRAMYRAKSAGKGQYAFH